MPKRSAGLLLYRRTNGPVAVLLVHPGGPYWTRKDEGAWSIPKGEVDDDEDPLAAARREFREETGITVDGPCWPLGRFRQPGGKVVEAWAMEGDVEPTAVHSNTFELEWPPRSGQKRAFPEVDRAGWFEREDAERKIVRGQVSILQALWARLEQ